MTLPGVAAEVLAQLVRQELHLDQAPITDLVDLLEFKAGVPVAVMHMPAGVDGLAVKDPATGQVVIGVATTESPFRQRTTLAHELGHLLRGDEALFQRPHPRSGTTEETYANDYARHLLIPLVAVANLLGTARLALDVQMRALSRVVQTFRVSPQLAAIQMRDSRLVDAIECADLMTKSAPSLATHFGWADEYEALKTESAQPRASQLILDRAIRGFQAGILPTSTLARIRNVPVAAMEQELSDAGITSQEHAISWFDFDSLDT